MTLQLGSIAPDFDAETTEGRIRFHEWLGSSWGILFSHPKDYTPVCTTELGAVAALKSEFDRRNVKILGLSIDPVSDHVNWARDIKDVTGHAMNYPMIGDSDLRVAKLYGMLPADAGNSSAGRTATTNRTVRNLFVIDPAKRIQLILIYPMATGRNFGEVLRAIDSLQLSFTHGVATPAGWKPGEDVLIAGSVSDKEAHEKYPQGWKAPKPYVRIIPQPRN
jgi:thioredoxin-dependent peroxiredoxin